MTQSGQKLSLKNAVGVILNFVPGFVILVFGMVALSATVQVMNQNDQLIKHYTKTSLNILSLEENYQEFENIYADFLDGGHGVSLENVKDSFLSFASFYYDDIRQKKWAEISNIDERYKLILHDIENELIVQSKTLEDKKSYNIGKVSGQSDVLKLRSAHSIEQKIESMWRVLHESKATNDLYDSLVSKEEILYWSVIAIGLAGFVLIVLNSSRLKQLKAANNEKQSHLKLLQDRFVAMESSFDGIGIVDQDGLLTYMNNALAEIHGVPLSDKISYLGQKWTKLYPEKGQEDIVNNVMPVLNEKGYWRGEKHIKRADGKLICADLSLTALSDGGFIGMARDVSLQRKAEQEKEALQSQFYQAQKMEAIGRLAGGIAHDFNNILAAMNGYAEFLIDDLDEKTPQHKFAKNILHAGQQARSLVDQMLAFSRIRDSEFIAMDLVSPIKDALSMIDASFSKMIEVDAQIALDQASIKGNETQISQVIMNLCVNAKDAMEGQHGELNISLDRVNTNLYNDLAIIEENLPETKTTAQVKIDEPEAGRIKLILNTIKSGVPYISLKISDTGSGMSREVLEHVFEPFFTTKSVDKGTGLGLATVHGVILEHQAAMIIDTKIGAGTTFEILFPEVVDVTSQKAEFEMTDVTLENITILLADDQPDVRNMMLAMLERAGANVLCAENGVQAIEMIQGASADIDLVLTDQNMPKLTGLEVVQSVQKDFPDIPFILMSGYSQKKLYSLMSENPAIKAVLRKPISQKDLKLKISEVVAKKS